jgi:hypothetical protein
MDGWSLFPGYADTGNRGNLRWGQLSGGGRPLFRERVDGGELAAFRWSQEAPPGRAFVWAMLPAALMAMGQAYSHRAFRQRHSRAFSPDGLCYPAP